ncbi:MAG: hypothetical protein IJS43_01870 [Bacteroidaceae bacterium]|nr:hypothetical protein [Bacteroidaceae bacterium]
MVTLIWLIIIGAVVYYFFSRKTKEGDMSIPSDAGGDDRAPNIPKTPSNKKDSESSDSGGGLKIAAFPYPSQTPSECRFPADSDNANFQEYGEVPVTMHESEFDEWWFFSEDLNKPCWSYVGLDKQNRCILQRRYRRGTPDNYTIVKRFFIIKRNIMASSFALALMNDNMERTDYFELIDKLNRLVPPTGDPEKDGPEILLPPQELLDNPSKEEIERAEQEKEKHELSGKVVYEDNKRKLYFAEDGHTPMMDYDGKTYTLSCHPYEPMLIILHKGENVAYIHNAFYPDDEYKRLLKGQLVLSITGKYHNAERFARLLTTALDTGCDEIGEVENRMMVGLARDKGAENIEYATYDFKCSRVLYEGVALLLGYFDCTTEIITRKSGNRKLVYALGFGYPKSDGKDMYEYYLISEEEYKEYMRWQERQDWESHEAAYEWHEAHLANRQVLCNEFSHMKKTYKPFFRLSEIRNNQSDPSDAGEDDRAPNDPSDAGGDDRTPSTPTIKTGPISIRYTRMSVCAQDDYINREHIMMLPQDATVKDLIGYIFHYQDDEGYAALPYTGGGSWWQITYNGGTLARVCDEPVKVIYVDVSPDTLVRNAGITKVYAKRE